MDHGLNGGGLIGLKISARLFIVNTTRGFHNSQFVITQI